VLSLLPHNDNNNNEDEVRYGKNYKEQQRAGASEKKMKRAMNVCIGHRKLDIF
jgi:hypothetical protein